MSGYENSKSISKYLANYAEAEIDALQDFPDVCYQHVVLIPSYRESPDFAIRFVSQFRHKKALLIVVINQPDDDEDSAGQQILWQQVSDLSETQWQSKNLKLQKFKQSAVQILMVDRFSDDLRIPKKQGVGLARKIAADIACKLIQQSRVKQSQIYSTDADAELPDNYFQNSMLSDSASAGVFTFSHISSGDPVIDAATTLYERRLHYYVDGLRFAGSSYAFHTIGSCLCFDMLAYCQARGFPKKSGGEDFYLLNKLAKTGAVVPLQPRIRIRARLSDRVPFGTGPAVTSIVNQRLDETSYEVYHPEIFNRLKQVLSALNKLCSDAMLDDFFASIDTSSQAFFEQVSFDVKFVKWQSQYSQVQLLTAVHQWFDAFRTLKYVHFLQSNELPGVPLTTAFKQLAQMHNLSKGASGHPGGNFATQLETKIQ